MDPAERPIVPEEIQSVQASTFSYFAHRKGEVVGVILGTLALMAIVTVVFNGVKDVTLLPLVIPVVWYSWVSKKVTDEFMQQFAAANHYQYSKTGSLDDMNGLVFKIGQNRSLRDMVTGTYAGYPLSIFIYSYDIGSGKSRRTVTYSIFELQFNTAMPDLFLMSAAWYLAVDASIAGLERLKLEGDFDTYFTLYIKKGYEIEALQVFTPEVMQSFIDRAQGFSAEISNNRLFLYREPSIRDKEHLYAAYDLAEYFAQTLGPVLARMKPSLVAEAAVAQEHAA